MTLSLPILLRLLSIAVQLAYVKSYTHYLSTQELGYGFYLTALSYAINALLLVPADFYQQAVLSDSYEGLFPLRDILSLNCKILLAATAFTLVAGSAICMAGKLSYPDLGMILGLAVSLYASTMVRNYLNNRGHSLFTGWMLLFEAALKLLSFILFLQGGMGHIHAFFLSTVTAFAVEFFFLLLFFCSRISFTFQARGGLTMQSMAGASSAVTFSAICNWLQLQGYRIVYVWLGFPETAGLYVVVSNIGLLGMNACSTIFSQTLLPRVYATRGTYLFEYLKYALALCLVVLFGYFTLGHVLLAILTKRGFVPFAGLMAFGVLIEGGNLLIGAATAYFTIRNSSRRLVVANIAGLAVAGLGVSVCLITKPQNCYLLGSVLAVSQIVVCCVLFIEARREHSFEVSNVQIL